MPNFKVVVSDPKSRKAYQKEVDQGQSGLIGKKIGEKVSGNNLGLAGYELEITGGSDKEGFPMRRDVEGIARKRILLAHPPGFHAKIQGQRKRKSVRGNTISPDISQINVKVVKAGPKTLDELIGAKPKEAEAKEAKKEEPEKAKEEKPAEAKPEEKPKEEKAEAPKEEPAKKEEKVEPEKPKETKPEKKEEAKPAAEEKKEEKPEAEKAEEKMGVKKLEEQEKGVKGETKEETKKPEKEKK